MAAYNTSNENRPRRKLFKSMIIATLCILLSGVFFAMAQAQPGQGRGGDRGGREGRGRRNITPEQMERMRERFTPEQIEQMRERFGQRGQEQPNAGDAAEKAEEKDEKAEEKKEDEKKDGEDEKSEEKPATVKRPDKPTREPSRDELKARPDEQGLVQFSFQGQPWKDVLQWYADVAGLSFDWQELPDGFLNLTTQRKYRLDETRDLLNRHLLARGFTMIVSGEIMSVVKASELDPSLIPRVEADELEDYLPHDFVRVRFQLPKTMEPEQAAKDVKILTSPNAKIQPLLSTKRLHVIDTVANLRNVRDLIYAEESAITEDVRPRQFMIQYRRADYVADQVMIILGLDPASRKSPQELQIEQQRMQIAQQMMKQGKDVSKMIGKDGPQVYFAVNQQRNSILVNADPAEMKMIEHTIEQVDVPVDGGLATAQGNLEFKKYQTETVSTESIISALKEIGGLHPLTQLKSDERSHTIFATATPDDHQKINDLIEKLDGSVRVGHVIWLNRRVQADQVAGTIQALMVGDEEDDQNSRRNPFSYYSSRYGNQEEEEEKMRIQADLENNRLLLWATAEEYAEVNTLLEEIGALTSPNSGNPAKVRVFEARSAEDTAKLLERLQKSWSGENEIEIQGLPSETNQPSNEPKKESPPENRDKVTDAGSRIPASFVQLRSEEPAAEAEEEKPAEATKKASPVRITVTPDGRLVVTSEDLDALDRMERLLEELQPPQEEFKLYELKNSRASLVVLNLEDYFEDELAEGDSGFNPFFGFRGSRNEDTGPTTLGKRRKIRFIWDIDTNSIMVQNASPAQIAVIDRLIKIYDQPIDEDSVAARRTEALQIKYSSAQDIADSVKEVFRDLLSSKDKEFQGREGEGGRSRTETRYRFFDSSSDSNEKSAPVKIAFEGALSIGVDEVSNTLIISAQEQVFETVIALARQLDEKAKPDTIVRVHQVRGSLPAEELKDAIEDALAQPWAGNKPPGAAAGGGRTGGNRGGDRGRDRGGNDRRRGR